MQHKQRFPSSLLIYDIIQTKVYQFARPAIYEHKLFKKKINNPNSYNHRQN